MKKNKIRLIAIGLFLHNGRILVFEGYDRVKEKYFFRPLGGAIKFGESGADALKREIQEEIGQDIEDNPFSGDDRKPVHAARGTGSRDRPGLFREI